MSTSVITKDQVENQWKVAAAKVSDLNNKINIALFDDNVDPEKIKNMKDERDKTVEIRDLAQEQLAQFTDNNAGNAQKSLKNIKAPEKTTREKVAENINNFVHSKYSNDAKVASDPSTGVASTVVSPTIPEEIIYNPGNEVNSVVDLSTLITKTPVTTASGTSPILKRADYAFPTVEELKQNPALGQPQFTDVEWKVQTHRGALAISNESMQDSQVDLSSLILQQMAEAKVNTYNAAISTILTGFTGATANNDNLSDAFKYLLNVALDPAYNPSIIVSQSMYNALDTLKDKNGQYIFHQDITGRSGDNLLGIPVHKVGDTLLGKAGEAHAFIGDMSRSIFFADRQNITLSWQYNEVYGQYLAGAMRFGTVAADKKAGYFLTANIPTSSIVKPVIIQSDTGSDQDKKDEGTH